MPHQSRRQLGFLLLAVAACNGTTPDAVNGGLARGDSVLDGPRHEVLVERNGTVLAEFRGAVGSAVLDGGHLTIELASPDKSHRLAIEVDGNDAGVYQLAPAFETAKAVVVLITRQTPGRMSPGKGRLELTRGGDGSCSGAFEGAAIDPRGFRYTFRGSFSGIPVRRL